MEAHKIYDYADRYVAGELTEKECDFVDQMMSEEGAFARTFVKYLAANEAAARLAKAKEKERLLSLFTTPSTAKRTAKRRLLNPKIRKLLGAAATLLIACLLGYWIWNSPPKDAVQVAVQELYQERIYDKVQMGAIQFDRLFQEERYREALVLLQKDPKPLPNVLERQGFCYWQIGDLEAALAIFEGLRKNSALKPAQNRALFYLAITYLKMGDKEKGRALLLELSKEKGHVYREKAVELLGKI